MPSDPYPFILVLSPDWLAPAVACIRWGIVGLEAETSGVTCPPNVDGCIPDSKCTSCHSTCAPGSCMSKSPGQCSDEDCTACPAGSYLLPRVVHDYDGVQQFSEVSAAAKVKKSIEDPALADLPQMQRLYAFKTGLRLPVSGMCNACPGSESGCNECQIVGPSGSGVRSWRCVHPPGAF